MGVLPVDLMKIIEVLQLPTLKPTRFPMYGPPRAVKG